MGKVPRLTGTRLLESLQSLQARMNNDVAIEGCFFSNFVQNYPCGRLSQKNPIALQNTLSISERFSSVNPAT